MTQYYLRVVLSGIQRTFVMYNKVNMSITVKTNCMTSCLLNISEITIEKINIANSQYMFISGRVIHSLVVVMTVIESLMFPLNHLFWYLQITGQVLLMMKHGNDH